MYATVLAAALVAPAQPPATHEDQNALYKSLRETGVTVDKAKARFPAPTMPDGLDGAGQTDVIKRLIENSYEYDEFVRKSGSAPQLLKVNEAPAGAADAKRVVDVWFVVYGDFKLLEDEKFLEKLTGSNKGGGKSVGLTAEDLKKRNITIPKGNEKRETYGHVEFDFLNKVRLELTGHAMWSRTADSVVAAAEVDPRFQTDKEFPNQWRSLARANGQLKAGDPHPWSSAALYLKVTKLKEPADALFVEQHIIYSEPFGWFDGANLLGSKLPLAIQDNVRTMRKEFGRGK
jgi:hypothetical protein